MTITLQVYDETRSAVLFDLNDPTSTYSGLYGSVRTDIVTQLDLGSPALQSSSVTAQDIDATFSPFSKRATAKIKGKLIITGSSYDNLNLAVGTLAQYLTQGCVMKYSAGTAVYFLDVLPSTTPALVAGQELALYKTGSVFKVDIDLDLVRQPYMRAAGLDASLNKLDNSTMLRDSNADGSPDSWTVVVGSGVISAANQALLWTSDGTTGTRSALSQTYNSVSPGDVYTFSVEAKLGTAPGYILRIEFLDGASATLSTDDSSTFTDTTFKRELLVSRTAPALTAKVRATLRVSQPSVASKSVYWRNAQLEATSNSNPVFRVKSQTVNLDPATSGFSKMLPVWNPGTAFSPMTIANAFPDASTNVQGMDFYLAHAGSIAGNNYLSDYLNGPYYAQAEANGNGWTLAAGTDTTLAGAVDATASPGSGTSVATITHATDPHTWNTRITFTRTTLLDSLRGTHRVFARVKPAGKKKYRLQLQWSSGSSITQTNDAVVMDQSTVTAVGWQLVDLGEITLPTNTSVTLNGLVMKLNTRMGLAEAATSLNVDYLMLVPQDNSAHITFEEAASVTGSSWTITEGGDLEIPKDLGASDPTWVTGAVRGSSIRLNAVNEAAGIGSTTTGAWTGATGGVKGVYFYCVLNNFIGTVNLEVANITDNDLLDLNGLSIAQQTVYSTASNTFLEATLVATDELNDKYQPRVTITAYTSGSIDVYSVSVFTVNAITQNQIIRTDPGSTGLDRYAVERLDSSSFLVGELAADRVPFWIPPGLSLLWVESYDVTTNGNDPPHFNARTLTVTPTVYPRYWA